GGVPRADGNWGACDPAEPKNRRTRCSLMVRRTEGLDPTAMTSVLVDTSPDLVRQTSEAGLKRLDGVLLTHDHADQVHGIDDIRAFAIRQRAVVPVWMDAATRASVERRFGYIFEGTGGYPAIAMPRRLPPHGDAWRIEGPSGDVPVVTFEQQHGSIRSVGYRFGDVAYSSDVDGLPQSAFAALEGVSVWIVDALRETPHPSHAHLARTLEWIERVRPGRAILTNLHVDMDYRALKAKLPAGVEPAFDGMRFEA
ncbi:MAG: phosphoribosyl 1,2-cyclic phosphodiesterase, partial [Caulobacteraceae bacterium]|nr:phosphoribosyl 1,2-cyclic phosphodiesterase [Caulobacteraceae bacterium]